MNDGHQKMLGTASSLEQEIRAVVTLGALEPLADALPHGVLVIGPDGTIRLTNRLLETQFGYERGDLIGQSVERLLPDTLSELVGQHGRAVLALVGAPASDSEPDVLGRRRDGSTFPVEIGLNTVHTAEGLLILAAIVDVSARREVELAARRSVEDRLDFERRLADVSLQFVNVPGDQVSEAIRLALEQVGESLDLDRCMFYRVEPDGMLVDPISWQRADSPAAAPIAAASQFPWMLEALRAGRIVSFNRVDEIPNEVDREGCRQRGARSAVLVPLSVGGQLVGAVAFSMVREERMWTDDILHRLRTVGAVFAGVLARRQGEHALNDALAEVKRLSDQLHAENVYLRREVQERLGTGLLVGQSPAVRNVMELVKKEAAHTGIPDLIVVASMHQRKSQMADMSDGFIALPGGIGTMEGLFEILTWGQLGIHRKPSGLLNVAGYFDDLIKFLDHAVAEGFLTEEHRATIMVETEPEKLLKRMRAYAPAEGGEALMGRANR